MDFAQEARILEEQRQAWHALTKTIPTLAPKVLGLPNAVRLVNPLDTRGSPPMPQLTLAAALRRWR